MELKLKKNWFINEAELYQTVLKSTPSPSWRSSQWLRLARGSGKTAPEAVSKAPTKRPPLVSLAWLLNSFKLGSRAHVPRLSFKGKRNTRPVLRKPSVQQPSHLTNQVHGHNKEKKVI